MPSETPTRCDPVPLNWSDWVDSRRVGDIAWRVRVRHWLPAAFAERLQRTLEGHLPWEWVYQRSGVEHSMPLSQTLTLARAQLKTMWAGIHQSAADGFQFSFRKYSMVEALRNGKLEQDTLNAFIQSIANGMTLSTVRELTGCKDIARVDAQVTRYDAGDFLTLHTDDNDAKFVRRVAYVLNLSPVWQPDWGGLLHFYDEHGHVIDTFVPEFNTLNLFSVPQAHSVSMVVPFAKAPRLAITGWFTA